MKPLLSAYGMLIKVLAESPECVDYENDEAYIICPTD